MPAFTTLTEAPSRLQPSIPSRPWNEDVWYPPDLARK